MELVLLEKLTVPQLVDILPAFYGTQKLITAFKWACHLSLSFSQTNPVHAFQFHFKINFNIILPSALYLPSGLFLSGLHT
jgi:hypothetical protein